MPPAIAPSLRRSLDTQIGGRVRTIALVGNPNAGKTTLYNKLARTRRKTANFPGTTQEAHFGLCPGGGPELIDLPGVYSLHLDEPESRVCMGALVGAASPVGRPARVPDAAIVVCTPSTLSRSIRLAREVMQQGLPTALVINADASHQPAALDTAAITGALGIPALVVNAGAGAHDRALTQLLGTLPDLPANDPPPTDDAEAWSSELAARVRVHRSIDPPLTAATDRLDHAFTHPVLGVATFIVVMTALFWAIFKLATIPMDLIDSAFVSLAAWVSQTLPPGILSELLTDGVITGIGATVIFLPQIVLLFFLFELLDSTGYLARAAFVIDPLLRPFGLSGHAFVPLLSSHACALPGIMAARTIRDPRERLATILVAPFMTCTARIPVYVLLVGVMFPSNALAQATAFTACYALGAMAGLLSALIARRTLVRGAARPMALELPAYRPPRLWQAVRVAGDRGWAFLRKAGTVILAISIVLWWLGEYPKPPAEQPPAAQVASEAAGAPAEHRTFLEQLGHLAQPVFAPIGADDQLTVGILASFAAREVFVSAVSVQVGVDEEEDEASFLDGIRTATREDGSPLFTTASAAAILVFFVLAMQCLPTLVVTAREAGHARYALIQLAWMTGLAYAAGSLTYAILS